MSQKRPGGLVLYFDHIGHTRFISDEERGRLLLVLADYAENGTLPENLSGAMAICFNMMKEAVDRNNDRYAETCERNRAKANKRWGKMPQDATACNGMPQDTAGCRTMPDYTDAMPNDADDANLNLNLNLNKNNSSICVADAPPTKKTKRFIPPTIEEVTAYCEEIGSSVDPQYFINYYEGNGWKIGNSKMKDWRATMRNWTLRENRGQSVRAIAPVSRRLTPIPTAEEYAEGVDASGFGWA